MAKTTGVGEGESGEVEHSLTTLVPYSALDVSDATRLWGALGWGSGDLEIRSATDERRMDTAWRMLAAGFHKDLETLPGLESEPLLDDVDFSLNADLRRTRTEWKQAGQDTQGLVTRARVGIKGSIVRELDNGGTLRPSLEMGLRRDGGDAERGRGVEISAGLNWSDPRGIGIQLQGRTVTLHSEEEYKDQSVSVSIDWDPRPASALGFSATLGMEQGATASLLHSQERFPTGLTDTNSEPHWRGQVSYGLRTANPKLVGSPYLSLSGGGQNKQVRLGYRVLPRPRDEAKIGMELDLYLRMERDVGAEQDMGAGAGLRVLW